MAYQKYGQHDQSYICDTLEDLKTLPMLNMGSTCYVISNASKYMINSKGEWVVQSSSKPASSGNSSVDLTGYATENYVDNAIAAIEIPSVEGLASEEYVTAAIAESNPVKDVYGDAHAFGLMVKTSDNKTLIQAMLEKGKVGIYNFHIEKGCPGQPEEVVAKNSSCRGIACVDTYRSDSNWYGWIIMIDHDGDTYIQYIRDAEPKGWKKVAFV